MLKFDKHIFVCTNQRAGKPGEKPSCGETHGMEIVEAFRSKLNARNLTVKVRAQKSGCLGICLYGQTVVVYPEGIFYVGVELNDVDEIIEEHIVNNRTVQRLVLSSDKY
jgi:(2Fe-2S) ferredoxin